MENNFNNLKIIQKTILMSFVFILANFATVNADQNQFEKLNQNQNQFEIPNQDQAQSQILSDSEEDLRTYTESLLPDSANSDRQLTLDLARQLVLLNKQKPTCVDATSEKIKKVYPTVKLQGTKSGDLLISTLTESQAKELFEKLAKESNIPFGYPDNGCNARAHKMAQLLEQFGIRSAKVFAEGHLLAETANSPAGYVRWSYHVAVTLSVIDKNGKIKLMVFDPALFDHMVPVKEWTDKISDKEENKPKVYFTERFNYISLGKEDGKGMNLRVGKWADVDNYMMESSLNQQRVLQEDRQNGKEQPPDQDFDFNIGAGFSGESQE